MVKNMNWHCDPDKLRKILDAENRAPAFYCGGATNFSEIVGLFDLVIMLTADEDIIRERLRNREGNDFGKTQEVQDHIFTLREAVEEDIKQRGAVVIDSGGTLDELVGAVLAAAGIV